MHFQSILTNIYDQVWGGIILVIIIISWTDITHLVFRLEYNI